MSTVVLSVRVRRELKEEAERLGIDLRAVVEKALEEEIRRARMHRLRRLIDEALDAMDLTVEEWVQAVRETRKER
ncbi:type II toxin-antitoxin system CcdA family antitoxin [Pyrodictium abyssi]|uniref:Type II toxin-antitoxin system CcdA family antitoxin n=1 Tax=Pyrodictium abyssi TaxID=54256 RepID=A0ABM8IY12_9CREN|nr:type II toxin-antitoxin system CcdA family antitoxin [Pyrodictium abyssi]